MMRHVVSVASGSFIVGCALSHFSQGLLEFSILLGLSSLIAFFFLRDNKAIGSVCIALMFLSLGIVRVVLAPSAPDMPQQFFTGTSEIRGLVTSDIEHRKHYSRFQVEIESVNAEPVAGEVRVLAYDEYPTPCVRGEEILLRGRLQRPKNFETAGGRVFEYAEHLRQQGVHALVFVEEVSCTGYPNKGTFNVFSFVREKFVLAVQSVLPQKEGTLLNGLLLGLRGNFSDETLEHFRITGLLHIIVLSGYNVTLVAETIRRIALVLAPKRSLLVSLLSIIVFVLLAGAQAPAVRAGGMGSIALIAKALHREYDGVRSLMLVVALMVLYDPAQVFSLSLHMSFLATLGLLLFSKYFEDRLAFITNKLQVRSIIAVTVATQLFLIPYLAYAIGEVSIIGLAANILVLPLVPFAMLTGTVVGVFTLISHFLGAVFSPLALVPLHLILTIAEKLSRVTFATAPLPAISAFSVVALYGALIILGVHVKTRSERPSYRRQAVATTDDTKQN